MNQTFDVAQEGTEKKSFLLRNATLLYALLSEEDYRSVEAKKVICIIFFFYL